jgi:hypothetical protein
MHPSAGITQIRFRGRWQSEPSSQPGFPKLPHLCGCHVQYTTALGARNLRSEKPPSRHRCVTYRHRRRGEGPLPVASAVPRPPHSLGVRRHDLLERLPRLDTTPDGLHPRRRNVQDPRAPSRPGGQVPGRMPRPPRAMTRRLPAPEATQRHGAGQHLERRDRQPGAPKQGVSPLPEPCRDRPPRRRAVDAHPSPGRLIVPGQ